MSKVTATFLRLLIGIAMFYGGFAVLWWQLGWVPAVAVYCMMCAHNLEYHRSKP